MNREIPPFYVGQRVVCVDATDSNFLDGGKNMLVQGKQYAVLGVRKECCSWCIDVGIQSHVTVSVCALCGNYYESGTNWYFKATRFAPIQEIFQAITLEKVIEQEIKLISVN